MASGIPMAPGLYFQYRDRARTLDSVALYRTESLTLTGAGEPERILVARATPSLGAVLRVPPSRGRWFSEAEGAPPVALLSHGLWMRRYGGDPGIVGRALRLDGVATEVIGIMPASYAFPQPHVDVWIPEPVTRTMQFGIFGYFGVARVRDGVSLAAAPVRRQLARSRRLRGDRTGPAGRRARRLLAAGAPRRAPEPAGGAARGLAD
jgi:hypothetical protein